MQRSKLTHRVLLTSLVALIFIACNPVKQGYNFLAKDRRSEAQNKFNQALKKPDQVPAAGYGLYKIKEREVLRSDYPTIQTAYLDLAQVHTKFSSLPEDRQKYYGNQKKIKLSEKKFNRSFGLLQGKALLAIEEHQDLLLLDSFYFNMSPIIRRLQPKYDALEDSLVMKNLNAREYEILRSIAKNHLRVLDRRRLRITPTFEFRLLRAFLRENPLSDLRKFGEDFPNHRAVADCFSEPFLKALESRKLADLMTFMATCPQSNADEVIVNGILFPVNNYLTNQLSSLSEEDRRTWEEVLLTTHLLNEGFREYSTPAAVVAVTQRLIQEAAPSNRSYELLVDAMGELWNRKAYDAAETLVRFAQPFFPNNGINECIQRYYIYNKQEAWFEEVIARLQAPTESPAKKWVTPINDQFPNVLAPIVSLDDTQLLFASDSGKRVGREIFSAAKKDTAWTAGIKDKSLSRQKDETPLGLTENGDLSLILVDTTLYLSKKNQVSGTWGKPKLVSVDLQEIAWVGAGTLSPDGNVLIFEGSSQPRAIENQYDTDLYLMIRNHEGRWSAPELLPGPINTGLQERAPFIHADGKTLIFSSRAHLGFAGFDAFMSVRQDSAWSQWGPIINLGKEVNSFADDWEDKFTLPASGKKVYLVSDNDGKWPAKFLQEKQLPTYGRPTRMVIMRGQIEDFTGATQLTMSQQFPTQDSGFFHTGIMANGMFQFLFPDEGRDSVFIYADDPEVYSTVVKVGLWDFPDVGNLENPPFTIAISKMIAREIPVPLNNPDFKRHSTELNKALRQELDWLTHYFINAPKRTLLIGGYADSEGGETQMEALALARAEEVKSYLISRGLPWDRIWTQGFGDKKNEFTAKGDFPNRRIDIFIK